MFDLDTTTVGGATLTWLATMLGMWKTLTARFDKQMEKHDLRIASLEKTSATRTDVKDSEARMVAALDRIDKTIENRFDRLERLAMNRKADTDAQ